MQKIDAYYLIIDYRITYLLFVNVDTFLQGGIPFWCYLPQAIKNPLYESETFSK